MRVSTSGRSPTVLADLQSARSAVTTTYIGRIPTVAEGARREPTGEAEAPPTKAEGEEARGAGRGWWSDVDGE
jgi:hypothetical protein